MEQPVRVESVTFLNHLLRGAALLEPPLQNVFGWELVVCHVEVVEGMLRHYLLVDLCEVLRSVGSETTDRCVGVKPAPARTDLKTIQKIVNLCISNV